MKKFTFILLIQGQKKRTTINAETYLLALHELLKKVHPSQVVEGFAFYHAISDDFRIPYVNLESLPCQV